MTVNPLDMMRNRSDQTVLKTLGIEIDEAAPELVRLSMQVDERHHQYTGLLHGGVSVVLAETAASIGAALNTDLARYTPVGVEINANHLRSVTSGKVTAEARPVYKGRQMTVWAIEVRDERSRLICVSRCTLALKPGSALAPEA
ncbi:MAG TPA: hotdog fold thioesterase [Pyrinomonadaceae bacterium]|nr:hotdog fold thioesterase [Pyrinomonadaceae bacterium]